MYERHYKNGTRCFLAKQTAYKDSCGLTLNCPLYLLSFLIIFISLILTFAALIPQTMLYKQCQSFSHIQHYSCPFLALASPLFDGQHLAEKPAWAAHKRPVNVGLFKVSVHL